MRLHAIVSGARSERGDVNAITIKTNKAHVQLSHRDAHTGEHAVRICWHYLQPFRDQCRRAIEEWFEVDEFLLKTVVVRLEAAQDGPFCSRIIVVISVGRGGRVTFGPTHTLQHDMCSMQRTS